MVSPSRSPSLVPSCSIANVQDLREVLDAPHPHRKLLEVDKASVPFVVDLLYTELQRPALDDAYRKRCIKCLKAMGNRFRALPSSLSMKDIRRKGKHPLTGGGFADIYKGTAGDITVCLKVLRVHLAESTKKKKQIIGGFCGEALIWTQLRHPNILPLLGINTELFPSGFCLVSPWMMNGNIVSFLKENPSHDKLQSICEIIAGLEYLHLLSPPIAHGDIKGANILVDEDHHCRLADFGLAAMSEESMSMMHTSSGAIKGSIRWMAPELYSLIDGTTAEKKSKEDKRPRDIYAFACTIFEILTGKPPFPDLTDAAVIYQVSIHNRRPERPLESECWFPSHIWKLVEHCWDEDPLKRPKAKALHSYLQRLLLSNAAPGDPGFIGFFVPATSATLPGHSSDRSSTSSIPKPLPPLPPQLPHRISEIPGPTSPSIVQFVTDFFRLNGLLLDEAVKKTRFDGNTSLSSGEQEAYNQAFCDSLRSCSHVFEAALDVIARLHTVIEGTVVAFKYNIVSFFGKTRDMMIVALMSRVQQTMALFLKLRNLWDPEDKGTDGRTIRDRLQDHVVNLTTDIEGAGEAIEASITQVNRKWRGKTICPTDVFRYSQIFEHRWQENLTQAFSHHPALNPAVAIPRPFGGGPDIGSAIPQSQTQSQSFPPASQERTTSRSATVPLSQMPPPLQSTPSLPPRAPLPRNPSKPKETGPRAGSLSLRPALSMFLPFLGLSSPTQEEKPALPAQTPPNLDRQNDTPRSPKPSRQNTDSPRSSTVSLPRKSTRHTDTPRSPTASLSKSTRQNTDTPRSSTISLPKPTRRNTDTSHSSTASVSRKSTGQDTDTPRSSTVSLPKSTRRNTDAPQSSTPSASLKKKPKAQEDQRRDPPTMLPRFVGTPPAAHMVVTDLELNQSLTVDTTTSLLDLATLIFPPLSDPNPLLLAQATDVRVSSMRLVFNEDDFVRSPSTIGLSSVDVEAQGLMPVLRIIDVLVGLHRALHSPIPHEAWSKLNIKEKTRINRAFERRYSRSANPSNVRNKGPKKIDYLDGRTKFRGLVEDRRRVYKVVLGYTPFAEQSY